ncbi:O-antigen ligase family protein [Alteromonadaceae bacterium BrNp21-10]|nr:O-antigen ligase family protein [Alteromonadaceae bacterium BrNp21-10]
MNNKIRHPEHAIILILMAGFLMVDTLMGVIETYAGIHLKVSLLYKTPVLLSICLIIALKDTKFTFWLLLSLLGFLIGPILALVKYSNSAALFFDITLILKVFTPILFFRYFTYIAEINPSLLSNWGSKVIYINYGVLFLNIFIGLFGFGYSSYNSGVGINGFFSAGNELGAVFIVLSAFVLTQCLLRSIKLYIIFSIITVLIGLLISTKTSILSAILLIILIPAVINRKEFFKPTQLKVTLAALFIILISISVAYSISILQSIGVWERVLWMYNKFGILGVILSGRDVYTVNLLEIFYQHNWVEWFFGIGTSGIFHHWLTVKESAEIDPIDVLIVFGHIGLFIALTMQLWILNALTTIKQPHNEALRKTAIIIFFMFLTLAFTSGHIWLSGMVGPFIGLVFAMAYIKNGKYN